MAKKEAIKFEVIEEVKPLRIRFLIAVKYKEQHYLTGDIITIMPDEYTDEIKKVSEII